MLDVEGQDGYEVIERNEVTSVVTVWKMRDLIDESLWLIREFALEDRESVAPASNPVPRPGALCPVLSVFICAARQ